MGETTRTVTPAFRKALICSSTKIPELESRSLGNMKDKTNTVIGASPHRKNGRAPPSRARSSRTRTTFAKLCRG